MKGARLWILFAIAVLAMVLGFLLVQGSPRENSVSSQEPGKSVGPQISSTGEVSSGQDADIQETERSIPDLKEFQRTDPSGPAAKEFRIRVVDIQGLPVAGALVRIFRGRTFLESEMDLEEFIKATTSQKSETQMLTDESGRCVVNASTPGSWIEASKEGFGTATLTVDLRANRELVLRLFRVCGVHGWVRDTDGNPVAGAEVAYSTETWTSINTSFGPSMSNPFQPTKVVVDSQGGFAIELPRGTAFVWAQRGLARSDSVRIDCEDGISQPLNLILEARAGLTVELVDPNGAPVAQAEVELSVWPPPGPESGSVGAQAHLNFSQNAETDSDGRAGFRDLSFGSYVVSATKKGFAPSRMAHVALSREANELVVLQLQRGGFIEGKVVRASGSPVGRALILATPERLLDAAEHGAGLKNEEPRAFFREEMRNEAQALKPYQATTNEQGEFRLGPLPEGEEQRIQCIPNPAERDFQMTLRRVMPGTKEIEIVIKDEQLRGVSASFVVLNVSGTPLANASYSLLHSAGWGVWDSSVRSGVADYKGRIYLPSLVLGDSYQLEIFSNRASSPTLWGPWKAEQSNEERSIRVLEPVEVEIEWQSEEGEDGRPYVSWQQAQSASRSDSKAWNHVGSNQKSLMLTPGRYRFRLRAAARRERIVEFEVRAGKPNRILL